MRRGLGHVDLQSWVSLIASTALYFRDNDELGSKLEAVAALARHAVAQIKVGVAGSRRYPSPVRKPDFSDPASGTSPCFSPFPACSLR